LPILEIVLDEMSCAKPVDVDRLLDDATIRLVNTDPPYSVKVEPRSNDADAAGCGRPLTYSVSFVSTWRYS
jgi:hypothetical protein